MQFYIPTNVINIPVAMIDPKNKKIRIFLPIGSIIKNTNGNKIRSSTILLVGFVP